MQIAILNQSTRYKNNTTLLTNMAAAVNVQLNQHVAPTWNLKDLQCAFYADSTKVPAGAYRLWILDNADQANALGYHDQDPQGVPYGRVFVNPIIKSGGTDYTSANSVSVTISHEVCEIVGDPEVNTWRQMSNSTLTCQELCDAVEGDAYPIAVNGLNILVSNFLLPPWFDYAPQAGSKFDYMNKLKAPFTMTRGGYMINMVNGKIRNIFGSKEAEVNFLNSESKKHVAARAYKRGAIKKPAPKFDFKLPMNIFRIFKR